MMFVCNCYWYDICSYVVKAAHKWDTHKYRQFMKQSIQMENFGPDE